MHQSYTPKGENGMKYKSVYGYVGIYTEYEPFIVEGINVVSRHTKPRKQGEEGGILKKEAAIYACKVQKVCPKCGKATRPAHKMLADGKKVCVCKKCGAEI
jgi:ribosomal protein L24